MRKVLLSLALILVLSSPTLTSAGLAVRLPSFSSFVADTATHLSSSKHGNHKGHAHHGLYSHLDPKLEAPHGVPRKALLSGYKLLTKTQKDQVKTELKTILKKAKDVKKFNVLKAALKRLSRSKHHNHVGAFVKTLTKEDNKAIKALLKELKAKSKAKKSTPHSAPHKPAKKLSQKEARDHFNGLSKNQKLAHVAKKLRRYIRKQQRLAKAVLGWQHLLKDQQDKLIADAKSRKGPVNKSAGKKKGYRF